MPREAPHALHPLYEACLCYQNHSRGETRPSAAVWQMLLYSTNSREWVEIVGLVGSCCWQRDLVGYHPQSLG